MNRSENALVATLRLSGDTFSFADPTGQGYVARLDGTETPVRGDLSHTLVSVRRAGENTIEETDRRNGKVVEVNRFTLAADGKTMTLSIANKLQGTTRQFVLHRQ